MTDPALAVRRATIKDVDTIAPLFGAYRAFYKQPSDPAKEHEFIERRIERGESVILIALTSNGATAGFAQLYPTFTSVRLGSEWILNDLFVAPEHRRAGAGRALVESCMDLARHSGALGLELLTEVDNAAAQALYESLGWKRTTEYYRYTVKI